MKIIWKISDELRIISNNSHVLDERIHQACTDIDTLKFLIELQAHFKMLNIYIDLLEKTVKEGEK